MKIGRQNKKGNQILLAVLISFVSLCLLVNYFPRTASIRSFLQVDHVPSELLSYNKLGELFYKLNIIKVIPNHSMRYKPRYQENLAESDGPFQKRRHVGDALLTPGPGDKILDQARQVLEKRSLNQNNFYLSVLTEKNSIHGEKGILTNFDQHGSSWERLAYIALYKGNNIIQNSAAGIRLHGGSSRRPDLLKHSYRLYFRKIYGDKNLTTAQLFTTHDTIRTLVAHVDTPEEWPLNNVIANEFYRMIGVDTLSYIPAQFFLNGEDCGLYWLSPHLSRKYIETTYGIKKIFYQRYKGNSDDGEFRDEISPLAYDYSKTLNRERVESVIDLDDLINYFIAVTYSGNTDWNQGVAYKDKENPYSIWHWIAWDVDHSFIDIYKDKSENPKREEWQQSGMDLLLNGELRRVRFKRQLILRRLLVEDPDFENVFLQRYVNVLNHDISITRLEALYQKYSDILNGYDIKINPQLLRFFRNRHSFIREELSRNFNIQFQDVLVKGDGISVVNIDGSIEPLPYKGEYPLNSTIQVVSSERHRDGYWQVNGVKQEQQEIIIPVKGPMIIEFINSN